MAIFTLFILMISSRTKGAIFNKVEYMTNIKIPIKKMNILCVVIFFFIRLNLINK